MCRREGIQRCTCFFFFFFLILFIFFFNFVLFFVLCNLALIVVAMILLDPAGDATIWRVYSSSPLRGWGFNWESALVMPTATYAEKKDIAARAGF